MWFLFVVINTAVLTLNLCYCIHVAIFLFTAAVFIGSSKRFICSWGVKTFFIKKEKRKKKKKERKERKVCPIMIAVELLGHKSHVCKSPVVHLFWHWSPRAQYSVTGALPWKRGEHFGSEVGLNH